MSRFVAFALLGLLGSLFDTSEANAFGGRLSQRGSSTTTDCAPMTTCQSSNVCATLNVCPPTTSYTPPMSACPSPYTSSAMSGCQPSNGCWPMCSTATMNVCQPTNACGAGPGQECKTIWVEEPYTYTVTVPVTKTITLGNGQTVTVTEMSSETRTGTRTVQRTVAAPVAGTTPGPSTLVIELEARMTRLELLLGKLNLIDPDPEALRLKLEQIERERKELLDRLKKASGETGNR